MSTEYTKTNWQDGDIITADKMNNIENGVKGIEEDVSNLKDGLSNTLTLDYTKATRLARNTDFNTLYKGNYYVGSYGDGSTMINAPSRYGGRLTVLETYSASTNVLQIFADSNGAVYYRLGASSSFGNWYQIGSKADITSAVTTATNALQSNIDTLSGNVLQELDVGSAFPTSKSNLLSNVSEIVVINARAADWNDKPINTSGVFYNIKYTTNYDEQFFVQISTGIIWERIISRNDRSVYRNWTQVSGLPSVKILALGDSICYGSRNGNKGFVGDLGLPYKNIGVSGASLSTKVTSVKNIPQQLLDETAYAPDIIIADGGINDYFQSAPMGTIGDAPAANDTDANALDKSTVIGGLSYLFYLMVKKYPKAQRFFVITHKTKRQDSYTFYAPTTRNSAGYTQQTLHDNIVSVCNLYNVKVIDVYNDGIINTIHSQYVSPTSYSTDASVTDTQYVDADGIHPLAYGYKEGYIPLIRQAVEIGTVK